MKTFNERMDGIQSKLSKKRAKRRAVIATSLSAVLALSFGSLFIPYTSDGYDITKFSSSEYYSVIEKLEGTVYRTPRPYNNAFEQIGYALGYFWRNEGGDICVDPPADDMPSSPENSYEETTLNQTSGVIEGDLLKRSTNYFYYLRNKDYFSEKRYWRDYELSIYDKQGEIVSTTKIGVEEGKSLTYAGYTDDAELYLSEDCKTITIVTPCYNTKNQVLYTELISVDVSNATAPEVKDRVYLSGDIISSRKVGGEFLVVNRYTAMNQPDYNYEYQYLPQYGDMDDMTSVSADDILCPEEVTSRGYTVIYRIDEDDLQITAVEALLSYSENIYVSAENIYVTKVSYKQVKEEEEKDGYVHVKTSYYSTEIARISYAQSLKYAASATVDGIVKDRFSMDEYEGVFRVVSEGQFFEQSYTLQGAVGEVPHYIYRGAEMTTVYNYNSKNYSDAIISCFDVGNMQSIARVDGFMPDDESVRSVRFDKNLAYVCTAVEYAAKITDPVFCFDLSDLQNITYKDTGTIPGYSLSLVKFTGGTLLGIGFGDSRDELKIEVYYTSEDRVESLCEYKKFCSFSEKFKAYYINAEEGYIGLMTGEGCYILLRFDGYNLIEVGAISLSSSVDDARAVIEGETLYLFGTEKGKTIKIN